ncbi:hypothetical protein CDAR_86041 [Caerostris darwini]|uniref:Uncharacterized protein n=1 Tax=Caerostris darwini TaxID=1538125 RepID=A0AAV4V4E6_9ARAC|nr:hypothetical protein CDAR_86041 [Caerostris darwini]
MKIASAAVASFQADFECQERHSYWIFFFSLLFVFSNTTAQLVDSSGSVTSAPPPAETSDNVRDAPSLGKQPATGTSFCPTAII